MPVHIKEPTATVAGEGGGETHTVLEKCCGNPTDVRHYSRLGSATLMQLAFPQVKRPKFSVGNKRSLLDTRKKIHVQKIVIAALLPLLLPLLLLLLIFIIIIVIFLLLLLLLLSVAAELFRGHLDDSSFYAFRFVPESAETETDSVRVNRKINND